MERDILVFETSGGKCPFMDWLSGLRDVKARAVIRARLERVKLGNFGDCKAIGDGVSELRINFGPGYRVYFGQEGSAAIILLSGGDKGRQRKDIARAKLFWMEHEHGRKELSK